MLSNTKLRELIYAEFGVKESRGSVDLKFDFDDSVSDPFEGCDALLDLIGQRLSVIRSKLADSKTMQQRGWSRGEWRLRLRQIYMILRLEEYASFPVLVYHVVVEAGHILKVLESHGHVPKNNKDARVRMALHVIDFQMRFRCLGKFQSDFHALTSSRLKNPVGGYIKKGTLVRDALAILAVKRATAAKPPEVAGAVAVILQDVGIGGFKATWSPETLRKQSAKARKMSRADYEPEPDWIR
jgi:hypothetical protein